MANSWRPDNWEHCPSWLSARCNECYEYEAGADAMLEALKKTGMSVSSIEEWYDIPTLVRKFNVRPAIGESIGQVIFIPDDDNEEN